MFKTASYSDVHTHQLFTGYRGCGKSTELLRLQQRPEGDGFYVVYFAVGEDLDPHDLIYTDLLLSRARRVVGQTSEDDINLGGALKTVETRFAEVVYEEDGWEGVEEELKNEAGLGIGLPKGLPFLASLLTRLMGQIKTGDEIE